MVANSHYQLSWIMTPNDNIEKVTKMNGFIIRIPISRLISIPK